MSAFRTFSLLTVLSVVAAAMLGCASKAVDGEFAGARAYRTSERRSYNALVTPKAAEVKLPKNRYLAIQAKKKAQDARGAIVVRCDLWAPFRWEVTAGVFDPKYEERTTGTIFGTELDARGPFPPTRFYGVSAEFRDGGLDAYAFWHGSQQSIGSHFFPGARRLDFAIEADVDQMRFYARENQTFDWQEIASVAFDGDLEPLNPSIGAFRMGGKAKVGFDDWQVVVNSPAPRPLTRAQTVARAIWDAVGGITATLHALDGAAPDWASLDAILANSEAGLENALLASEALEDGKPKKKGRKALKSALKKVGKALKKVEDENAGSAIDKLQSAMKGIFDAVGRIDPVEGS